MSSPVPEAPTQPVASTLSAGDLDVIIARVTNAVVPLAKSAAQTEISSAKAAIEDTIDRTHENSIALISGVAKDVEANKQQIEATAASVGQSFVNRLVKDVWLQRALILLVAGTFLAGGFALLAFYLAGSPQAAKAIGWLGLLFGAPLAAAIHQAIGGPGAAKVPVAPVATATTPTVSP